MAEKRIEWVDTLKGLAIILVVIGHSGIPLEINKYILSFHMPLFFIISGLLYNKKKYDSYSFKDYSIKQFKALIVPYLWFSLLTLVLTFTVKLILLSETVSLKFPVLSILAVRNYHNDSMIEGVLWFLPSLFVVELLFFLIARNKFLYKYLTVLLFFSSVIGFILSKLTNHITPFTIDIAFTAIVFFGLGFLLRDRVFRFVGYFSTKQTHSILVIALLFAVSLLSIILDKGTLYMYVNEYGNYFWTYLGAVTGSLTFILISANLKATKVITFLGQNSLLVFVIHLKINFVTKRMVELFGDTFMATLGMSLMNTIIILTILVPIIITINKYFPFLTGKPLLKKQVNPGQIIKST